MKIGATCISEGPCFLKEGGLLEDYISNQCLQGGGAGLGDWCQGVEVMPYSSQWSSVELWNLFFGWQNIIIKHWAEFPQFLSEKELGCCPDVGKSIDEEEMWEKGHAGRQGSRRLLPGSSVGEGKTERTIGIIQRKESGGRLLLSAADQRFGFEDGSSIISTHTTLPLVKTHISFK